MVNVVNALLGLFILLLIVWEWNWEQKKSGKAEATRKILFGALMFTFFYGLYTHDLELVSPCYWSSCDLGVKQGSGVCGFCKRPADDGN